MQYRPEPSSTVCPKPHPDFVAQQSCSCWPRLSRSPLLRGSTPEPAPVQASSLPPWVRSWAPLLRAVLLVRSAEAPGGVAKAAPRPKSPVAFPSPYLLLLTAPMDEPV